MVSFLSQCISEVINIDVVFLYLLHPNSIDAAEVFRACFCS